MRVEARADAFVHLAALLSLDGQVAVGDWLVSTNRRDPLTIEDVGGCVAAL